MGLTKYSGISGIIASILFGVWLYTFAMYILDILYAIQNFDIWNPSESANHLYQVATDPIKITILLYLPYFIGFFIFIFSFGKFGVAWREKKILVAPISAILGMIFAIGLILFANGIITLIDSIAQFKDSVGSLNPMDTYNALKGMIAGIGQFLSGFIILMYIGMIWGSFLALSYYYTKGQIGVLGGIMVETTFLIPIGLFLCGIADLMID